MGDLSSLHAQATRLILALREGMERLEAIEVRRCVLCRAPSLASCDCDSASAVARHRCAGVSSASPATPSHP